MIRILFVCHGNICRSPMAEFVMKQLVQQQGAGHLFEIASAATSTEEIGNDVYPPAKRAMDEHGVPYERRRARQVRADEVHEWDYIICMDDANVRNLRRMLRHAGVEDPGTIHKLMEFARSTRPTSKAARDALYAPDVSDPWYTGDFETCYQDVLAGCTGLFAAIESPNSRA